MTAKSADKCQLVRRPKHWVGVPGVPLFAVGLLAGWRERNDRAHAIAFLLLALIPPTYLLGFANINHPHDYYQLIIAPFLAVVSANGLRWLLVRELAGKNDWTPQWRVAVGSTCALLVAAAPLTYLLWKKQPNLVKAVVQFERLCAAKVEPGRSAKIFTIPWRDPIAPSA